MSQRSTASAWLIALVFTFAISLSAIGVVGVIAQNASAQAVPCDNPDGCDDDDEEGGTCTNCTASSGTCSCKASGDGNCSSSCGTSCYTRDALGNCIEYRTTCACYCGGLGESRICAA